MMAENTLVMVIHVFFSFCFLFFFTCNLSKKNTYSILDNKGNDIAFNKGQTRWECNPLNARSLNFETNLSPYSIASFSTLIFLATNKSRTRGGRKTRQSIQCVWELLSLNSRRRCMKRNSNFRWNIVSGFQVLRKEY